MAPTPSLEVLAASELDTIEGLVGKSFVAYASAVAERRKINEKNAETRDRTRDL